MNLASNHTSTNAGHLADVGIHYAEVLDVATAIYTTEQASLALVVHVHSQVADDVVLSVEHTLEGNLGTIVSKEADWWKVGNLTHIQIVHQTNLYLVVAFVNNLAANIAKFLGHSDIVPSFLIRFDDTVRCTADHAVTVLVVLMRRQYYLAGRIAVGHRSFGCSVTVQLTCGIYLFVRFTKHRIVILT